MDIFGRIRGVVGKWAHLPTGSQEELLAVVAGVRGGGEAGTMLAASGALRWRHGDIKLDETGEPSGVADWLWMSWMGVLSESPGWGVLWDEGFAGQGAEGPVHRWDPEEAVEGFVYEELRAIHAAYAVAKTVGRPEMMERVRRAVVWHVANTQPDHATNEPWGLAAFAELGEDGGMFAELQLHAAVAALERGGGAGAKGAERSVIVGLLADALLISGSAGA